MSIVRKVKNNTRMSLFALKSRCASLCAVKPLVFGIAYGLFQEAGTDLRAVGFLYRGIIGYIFSVIEKVPWYNEIFTTLEKWVDTFLNNFSMNELGTLVAAGFIAAAVKALISLAIRVSFKVRIAARKKRNKSYGTNNSSSGALTSIATK